jgi:hypothetical protein
MLFVAFIFFRSRSNRLLQPQIREKFPQKQLSWQGPNVNAAPIEFVRIGHATTLITVNKKAILTDPWFSEKKGNIMASQSHSP